jgi:hypothetical protein
LASSFTFSSCKDCGKKKPKPADRDNKTSTEDNNKTASGDNSNTPGNDNISDNTPDDSDTSGDDNISDNALPSPESNIPGSKPKPFPEELTLSGIEPLVKEAVGYAIDACMGRIIAHTVYGYPPPYYDVKGAQDAAAEAVTSRENMEKLERKVARAAKSGDKNITDRVNAIGLLLAKTKREEKAAVLYASLALEKRDGVVAPLDEYNAEKSARNEWRAKLAALENGDALKIIEAMWMAAHMRLDNFNW